MEENQNTNIVDREETDHIVDVEQLVSSIEETMSQDLFMSDNRCIFKTPTSLYRQNERAYIPDAFSIGPFHHGDPILKATETLKAKCLQNFLSRFEPPTMLRDMINYIRTKEEWARACYAGPINYSSDEFVKILLIDSCFIIELFYSNAYGHGDSGGDPIFGTRSMLEVLDHDLILLENQVPWAILEDLFGMSMSLRREKTLVELAIEFFRNVYSFTIPDQLEDIKHIPDLFKKLLVSSMVLAGFGNETPYRWEPVPSDTRLLEPGNGTPYRWEPVPSATRLLEPGIKFRKSKSTNMFDIKFSNGVLEIPQIRIHEITETFIKNLISFEQCCPNSDDMITSYAILLDNLIDTTKDVEILRERNILSICMNPEDAVQFFNKLYHTSCVNDFKYVALCKDLNAHCQTKWPTWRALLVRRYFNNPWAGLSTGAAVTLLILALLQTIFTIIK